MAQVQRKLVHKQFNSPIGLYSDNNVKATLDRELKVLSNGTMGIDFDDTPKPANLANSAVLRMLEEEENHKRQYFVQPGIKRVAWPPEQERTPVRTFAAAQQIQQQRQQSPAQQPSQQQQPGGYNNYQQQNTQKPNYLNGNLPQSQSNNIPSNQGAQPIYNQHPGQLNQNQQQPQQQQQQPQPQQTYPYYNNNSLSQQQQQQPNNYNNQSQDYQPQEPQQQNSTYPIGGQPLYQRQYTPQLNNNNNNSSGYQPQHSQSQPPQTQPIINRVGPPNVAVDPNSNFVNPDPTFMQPNLLPSYITPPKSIYPRGASPSTTAFSGGLPITVVGNKPTVSPYGQTSGYNTPSQSQSYSNIPQQYSASQSSIGGAGGIGSGVGVIGSGIGGGIGSGIIGSGIGSGIIGSGIGAGIGSGISGNIPQSPDVGQNLRGWSHVNSPIPNQFGYTQNYPSNQQQPNIQSSPSYGSIGGGGDQSYIGNQQNQYSNQYDQQQPQQPQQYQQPINKQPYQQQQPQQPNQPMKQPQFNNYQAPQQQQQQQQQPPQQFNNYPNQQQQPSPQQQQYQQTPPQRQQSFTTESALQQQRQASLPANHPSSGIITLRKEPPISQKKAPVFASQPATVKFGGGGNMRGDLKWPPIEYKQAAVVENELRKKLALGPEFRPTRVEKDYSEFFRRHALNSAYPGYKAPPGTQYFAYGNSNSQ